MSLKRKGSIIFILILVLSLALLSSCTGKPGTGSDSTQAEVTSSADATSGGDTGNSPDTTATPATDPVTEEITTAEPGSDTAPASTGTENTTTPGTQPETGDITAPVTEPVTEEVTTPVTEPVTEEITTPATEPVTEELTTPVTDPVTEAHVHAFGPYETVTPATCTAQGSEKHTCSCGYSETRTVKAKGHTVVIDAAVSPSCGVTGKTEGSHCSVCGTVITAQVTLQAVNHSYYPSSGICANCGQKDPLFGTLIYYEGFSAQALSTTSDTVLSNLGWIKDTTSNGAYKNNTASYSIVSKNGSNMLYIKNNVTDASDSYIIVLTEAQFGKYHESNYTYQYDIIYDDASAADRYIALVSDYNGSFYNTFHLRNRGTANNQAHSAASWITYDTSGAVNYAANTNSNSIVTRLLGKTYNADSQVLKGISLSVRYVVDWTNGNKVYIRVNTAGYPGSGVWTLVSEGKAGGSFTPDSSGGAIVLKTGGRQNGWIDNIIIWSGTGDQPSLNYKAPLTSKTDGCSGHKFKGAGTCLDPEKCVYCGTVKVATSHSYVSITGVSDRKCKVCGALESNAGSTWLLPGIPAYSGGKPASALYLAGQGLNDSTLKKTNESEELVIASTTASQYDTYCKKLETYGYSKTFSNAYDSNKFAEYYNGTTRIYTYFTAATKEVRIIIDRNSTASATDFGYTVTPAAGQETVVYQYGLPMSVQGTGISSNGENKIDCGMMYIIKQCDNKLFVIDGGGFQQFDTAEIDGLYSFMREITGIPEGQKIVISGWYITHCHSDHLAGFSLFLKKYSKQLTFERFMCNFPSVYSSDTVLSGHKSNLSKLATYIKTYIGSSVPFLKVHTGEYIDIANIRINVLYTHEDLVSSSSGATQIASDFNNSSIVSRFDFEGIRFMVLGDINKPAQNKILAINSTSTLKSDIVQLAHHVINDVRNLYNAIQATAVLVPQSPNGSTRGSRYQWFNIAKSYVKDNMLYYASEGTYGIKAVDGKPVLAYSREGVDGGAYSGWGW